jgi:hypothetical protein
MSASFSPDAVWGRLLSASDPADIISASWVAFECIRLCANELAGQVTRHFATWVTAAAPACEGRDALGRAPAMPAAAACPGPLCRIAGESEDAAARLIGGLAALLEERLGAAARQAATAADATACTRAARAAAEIRELFAGAGTWP